MCVLELLGKQVNNTPSSHVKIQSAISHIISLILKRERRPCKREIERN